jgi:hypothetical protein
MSNMQVVVQGKQWGLGRFADPVSAAICYDREATRAFGAAAILNFPPGSNSRLSSALAAGQPAVVPGNGESGEEAPSALPPGLPLAGNGDGNKVPYSGPKVRATSTYLS